MGKKTFVIYFDSEQEYSQFSFYNNTTTYYTIAGGPLMGRKSDGSTFTVANEGSGSTSSSFTFENYTGDTIDLSSNKIVEVDLKSYGADPVFVFTASTSTTQPTEAEIIIYGYSGASETITLSGITSTGVFDPELKNSCYISYNPLIAGDVDYRIDASVRTKSLYDYNWSINVGNVDSNTMTVSIPNYTTGEPNTSDFTIYNQTADFNHSITGVTVSGNVFTLNLTESVSGQNTVFLTYTRPSVEGRQIQINEQVIPSQVLLQSSVLLALYDHFDEASLDLTKWSVTNVTATTSASTVNILSDGAGVFANRIDSTTEITSGQTILLKGVTYYSTGFGNRGGIGLYINGSNRYVITPIGNTVYSIFSDGGATTRSNFTTIAPIGAADDFKISRTGSTLEAYYWSGSSASWVLIDSLNDFIGDNMPIRFSVEDSQALLDAVYITSGDFADNTP